MKKEKDKLERFIKDNQNHFDSDFNPEKTWKKIESEVKRDIPKKKNVWMIAASLALLLSLTWLVYDRGQLTEKISQMERISVNDKPYAEIESYYQQSINEKTALVNTISEKKNIKVDTDLKSLNRKYEKLKLKVKDQGGNPQLVNAMIQNLQTQIDILEQQLKILQELQEYEDQDQQKSSGLKNS